MPNRPSPDRFTSRTSLYRLLMGFSPNEVCIADDRDFDAHVFASLIAVAAAGSGPLNEGLGLTCADTAALIESRFPQACLHFTHDDFDIGADEEIVMVRDLLLAHRTTSGEDGRLLSFMIARRAMEPNHLWEDLGLRDRSELTRLLSRHFNSLAARNARNMRWKRFFYRTLCESEGLVMCATPVCTACPDFELCFGDESGDSKLAYRRRDIALNAAAA